MVKCWRKKLFKEYIQVRTKTDFFNSQNNILFMCANNLLFEARMRPIHLQDIMSRGKLISVDSTRVSQNSILRYKL